MISVDSESILNKPNLPRIIINFIAVKLYF